MDSSGLLADQLNAALPQTQCTRCGYPDCRSYAQAIASGAADINQCPPGGAEGVLRLARISAREPHALNPGNGQEGPRLLAIVDEAWCIGCTLCIEACPVDAIVGGPKRMHAVIAESCTGCELCVPVCPVDCISLSNITGTRTGWDAWSAAQAGEAAHRHELHMRRRARDERERDERLAARAREARMQEARIQEKTPPVVSTVATTSTAHSRIEPGTEAKHALIQAALARARASRRPG